MTVHIDENMCKGCGLCVKVCPQDVLKMSDRMNRKGFILPGINKDKKCTKCKLCEMSCPDLAIYIE